MTDIVFHNNGDLDKYMGDAIMAIYGAPMEQEDHPMSHMRECMIAFSRGIWVDNHRDELVAVQEQEAIEVARRRLYARSCTDWQRVSRSLDECPLMALPPAALARAPLLDKSAARNPLQCS